MQAGAPPVSRPPHFVQTAGAPVFIGQGNGALTCRCGQSELVRGYDPRAFLAVDFQCAACGAITTTPGLSALATPPTSIIPLERIGETSAHGTPIQAGAVLAGREEIDRLTMLYQPRQQPTPEMTVSAAFLDAMEADYDRLTGGLLAEHTAALNAADGGVAPGLKTHALLWALRTLRTDLGQPGWSCAGTDAYAVATAHIGAFRYFTDCWSHHPLFPMMAKAAADTGFSLHGLAPYAAAKALADSGNRVGFSVPQDGSERVRDFHIAIGPNERMACVIDVFDRFEWPNTPLPSAATVHAAVRERLEASKARVNLKHPGMLILSPGPFDTSLDQPTVDAIIDLMRTQGRRYRGLSGMGIILAKVKASWQPDTVAFGYTFYPWPNPRYTGAGVTQFSAGPL